MTEEPEKPETDWIQYTPVDLGTSDIRPLVRAQLRKLEEDTRKLSSKARGAVSRAHYLDASERISALLEGNSQR